MRLIGWLFNNGPAPVDPSTPDPIEAGRQHIGDGLRLIGDNLAEVARRQREAWGLDDGKGAVAALPPVTALPAATEAVESGSRTRGRAAK